MSSAVDGLDYLGYFTLYQQLNVEGDTGRSLHHLRAYQCLKNEPSGIRMSKSTCNLRWLGKWSACLFYN